MVPSSFQQTVFQAAGWKIFSCICFAGIGGVVHYLSRLPVQPIPAVQLAFFQISLGLVFSSLMWVIQKKRFFCVGLNRPVLAVTRAFFVVGGVWLWFLCLQHFPLGQVAAFKLLSPLLTALGAGFFLNESFSKARAWALTGTFFGALFLFQRDFIQQVGGEMNMMHGVPVAALLCFTASHILGKHLSHVGNSRMATFSLLLLCTPLLGLLSVKTWVMPGIHQWPWIFFLGGLSAGAYYGLNQALGLADLVFLIPLSFVRFLASTLISILCFGEFLNGLTLLGAFSIVVASVQLARSEACV